MKGIIVKMDDKKTEEEEIINSSDTDWGDDELENLDQEIEFQSSQEDEDWVDWSDIDWGEEEFSFDGEYNSSLSITDDSNQIYSLEGYGDIYLLDKYLDNANGVIELLDHSKSKEQFNYILGMSKPEAHNETLLDYLKGKNYKIEDYVSINVGYNIFAFKNLVEYLISQSNEENIKQLLGKIAYVDENIASIVAKRDDILEMMKSNYHLRDKIVVEKILEFFEKNPEKINFDFVNICDLDTDTIRKLIGLGYVINETSPYAIMQNNEIMRDEFLNSVEIQNQEIISDIDEQFKNIPGSYGRLYRSKNKEVFSDAFMSAFSKEEFEQILKYIVLSDYDINFSQIINDGKIRINKKHI